MLIPFVVVYHAIQRIVVDCYGLLPAEGNGSTDVHVVHLSEAFQYLSKLEVITIDSRGVYVLEAPLVFLDILVKEEFVQVFFCLEVEVRKSMGDCEICVFDLDHSLNVRSPMVFELLLAFLGLWLSEDVRAKDADSILMPNALSLHELQPFLLFFVQGRLSNLQEMFDEPAE